MNSQGISSLTIIFLVLGNLLASVQSQTTCLNNGNYTANSTYSANLKVALSALSRNIDDTGFYNVSVGQDSDRANAAALCRGDVQLDMCPGCFRSAADDLTKACPNQKQAYHWAEFCMVRYSNETIFGKLETSPMSSWWNENNAPNPDQFEKDVRRLLDNLRSRAAYGGTLRKVAAGNASVPDIPTIYALVQCTPNLSSDDCSRCLNESAQCIPKCCNRRAGCRVQRPSCTIRFERYLFYSKTGLQELAAAPPSGNGDSNKTRNVIIVVVSVATSVILAVTVGILLRKKMKQKPKDKHEIEDDIDAPESLQYAFSTIRHATNDFSDYNKLGQGGFGVVYKGKLLNGEEIAVKRLSRDSGQGNLEFKNEVLLLARLQHRNLVKFLGFSLERTERLLIYEFVQNSSLNQFIFDSIKRTYLDWNSHYNIIVGIARGLLYLHEDSRLRIIHRDLKASNVLLDKEMNPKIADFGMARLFDQDETHGNTSRIVGTYGYMSPEYAMHGQFSPKSDVFSFGVLVLEILTGQKNSYTQNEESAEDLLSFIWKNWSEGIAANVIDPILRASTNSMQDMLRCIHMGLLCVQENVIARPTMASIVLILNRDTITLPVPKKPAFSANSLYGPKISYDSKESNASSASKTKAANCEGNGDGNKTRNIIIVSVAASVILAITVGILLRKRMKQKPKEKYESGEVEDDISAPESLQYAFSTIKAATNDFSYHNKLGQGGFGIVYKGKLPNGQEIAVKRLSRDSKQGDLEFKNEVLSLAKLQHRNLVKLLGFSLEGMEKLLIYEFVQNGSLDRFIFDPIKHTYLDWNGRYKIIVGIAKGILYLHEDSRVRIIHRDLKASNILLDGEMNPKIADFGMARLFERDETQGNTSRIAGTYGYMAPEYAMQGQFSTKSDVFSFGVLMLEMISSKKNNYSRSGKNAVDLLSYAWRNWHNGTSANTVDPFLRSNSGSMGDIMRCIHIGLLCVQENAANRPTMASVILMLNSFSITLGVPSEPAFYLPNIDDLEVSLVREYNSRDLQSNNSSTSNNLTESYHSSRNDASVTELYPR